VRRWEEDAEGKARRFNIVVPFFSQRSRTFRVLRRVPQFDADLFMEAASSSEFGRGKVAPGRSSSTRVSRSSSGVSPLGSVV